MRLYLHDDQLPRVESDWVAVQARERRLRDLEADEREYEAKLANWRKRENATKKMAQARVTKRPVRIITYFQYCFLSRSLQQKIAQAPVKLECDDDEDAFLPDTDLALSNDNFSPAVRELMEKSVPP
jgi:hypothetical protein